MEDLAHQAIMVQEELVVHRMEHITSLVHLLSVVMDMEKT
jgi:hypothetical protein